MKKADELAVSYLGAESHKRRSTTLRRLSGGLQTEIKSSEATGLSKTEINTLSQAVSILNKLSSEYSKASAISKQRHEDSKKVEASIRKSMMENFDKISCVPGRIALIAAVNSYLLRPDSSITLNNVKDLEFWFRESMSSLAFNLASQANGRNAASVVAEAWSKFEGARSELERKYSHIIKRLNSAGVGAA